MAKLEATTVKLTISGLLNDLSQGLTWLKSEDAGFGSIQEKYNANDIQIARFREHEKLKNVEPTLIHFVLVDDTLEEADQLADIENAIILIDDVKEEEAPKPAPIANIVESIQNTPLFEENKTVEQSFESAPIAEVFNFVGGM